MPEFLDRIFGREPAKKTSTVAKERLQFILVHDRINLPPERMEAMKKEILEVIAKYVSVDNENVEIALEKRERNSALVAEIPFIKAYEDKEYEDLDDDDRPHSMFDDDDDEDDEPSPGEEPSPNNAQPINELVSEKLPADDAPPLDEDDDLQPPLDDFQPDEPPAAEKPKPNNTPKRKR